MISDGTKNVIRKNLRQTNYHLSQLYYALVNGHESIIYETYINHKLVYNELVTIPDYLFVNKIIEGGFNIQKSLKEEIKNKDVSVFLLNNEGNERNTITLNELINLVKIMNLLENISVSNLDELCMNICNKISDILCINVNSNPSSKLKFKEVDEVIIPATKVFKFKDLLFNYIKISMMLYGSITLSSGDYRIVSALKKAKIKMLEFQNLFTMTVKSNGEELLECDNIIQQFKSPKSFQKINSIKKA